MDSWTSPTARPARHFSGEARIARRALSRPPRTFVRATILSVRRCARDRSSKPLQRCSQRPKPSDWKLFLTALRGPASHATSRRVRLQHQILGVCPLSPLSRNERAGPAPKLLTPVHNKDRGYECCRDRATERPRICRRAVSSSFWIWRLKKLEARTP